MEPTFSRRNRLLEFRQHRLSEVQRTKHGPFLGMMRLHPPQNVVESPFPSASRLPAIESSCPRLWLVASHYGARNGPAASRRNYARYVQLRDTLRARYPQHHGATFGCSGTEWAIRRWRAW